MTKIIQFPNKKERNQMKYPELPKKKKKKGMSLLLKMVGTILLFTFVIGNGVCSLLDKQSVLVYLFVLFWVSIAGLSFYQVAKSEEDKKRNAYYL